MFLGQCTASVTQTPPPVLPGHRTANVTRTPLQVRDYGYGISDNGYCRGTGTGGGAGYPLSKCSTGTSTHLPAASYYSCETATRGCRTREHGAAGCMLALPIPLTRLLLSGTVSYVIARMPVFAALGSVQVGLWCTAKGTVKLYVGVAVRRCRCSLSPLLVVTVTVRHRRCS